MPFLRYQIEYNGEQVRMRTKEQILDEARMYESTLQNGEQITILDRKTGKTFHPSNCCRRCGRFLSADDSILRACGYICKNEMARDRCQN